MIKRSVLSIALLTVGLFHEIYCYDDFQLKCKQGYRVAKFSREGGPHLNVSRLTVQCEPFLPSFLAIKEIKCQPGKPIMCNGQLQGCSEPNSWIGGFTQFQLDESIPADLLVPLCCVAKNVTVISTNCFDHRLNSFETPINYTIRSTSVVTQLTCWPLTDTKNLLRDEIVTVKQCKYNVDIGDETIEEQKSTTEIVKQAFIVASDFPAPTAAVEVFEKEKEKRLLATKRISTTLTTTESSGSLIQDLETEPTTLLQEFTESPLPLSKNGTDGNHCAPCLCQCPDFQCPEDRRPIRRIRREKRGDCICHCFCGYRCV